MTKFKQTTSFGIEMFGFPMFPNFHITPKHNRLQDECKRQVRKLVVEETGKLLKVQAGWYTERQMKDTLKMPKLLWFNRRSA